MIRATTGGVMRTYRSNLMNSFINMNKSMNTVLSQRTFNSFAEDPAAAARAFRLRKSRMTLESQYEICTDVHKKYETAVACLQSNDDVLCTKQGEYGYYMKTLTGTTLSMLNDPEGDAREQLAKVLDQMSQQIIQSMNQKYGDNFIFAGADGHNVPFEIKDNVLYYRGVPVDADLPDILKNGDTFTLVGEDGKIIDDPTTVKDGDKVYYLRMESYNVKTISEKEYEELYTVPDRQTFADLAGWTVKHGSNDTMYAYNSIGELIPVIEDENEPGVYLFDYPSVDKEPHPNDKFITLDENNIYYMVTSDDPNADTDDFLLVSMKDSATLQTDLQDASENKSVQYDANGRINYSGGYYQRIYKDKSTKLISQQEFAETQARADDPPKILKTGDTIPADYKSVNEDGTLNDAGGGYYRIIDESHLIDPSAYEEQKLVWEKLQYLANETQFVDIGFGFQEDPVTGKLIETSAFNAALNGITFLGYGLDEDGDPRNIYSLVQEMRKVAESVSSGTDWDDPTYDKFYKLVQKFEDGVSNYQTEFVNLDASTGKLSSQVKLLEENVDNVWEQYSNIEDVDMAEAITAFLWAQYSYNAALRVGNSVLSQSLMDYLS